MSVIHLHDKLNLGRGMKSIEEIAGRLRKTKTNMGPDARFWRVTVRPHQRMDAKEMREWAERMVTERRRDYDELMRGSIHDRPSCTVDDYSLPYHTVVLMLETHKAASFVVGLHKGRFGGRPHYFAVAVVRRYLRGPSIEHDAYLRFERLEDEDLLMVLRIIAREDAKKSIFTDRRHYERPFEGIKYDEENDNKGL